MSAPALGRLAATIPASGIRALANAAWADPGAVHLEFGEPDFDTPAHVVEAAHRAARDGRTRYAPSAGVPELRAAACTKLERDNGLAGVAPDRVLISAGGVGGLHSAYRAVLDEGDEILVPDPGWPNLASIALAVGARPVRYRLAGGAALPDHGALDDLVGARTRAIVVNTPSNPTGATFTDEELRALGEWAARRGLWVISDECYDQLWLDHPTTTFSLLAPHTPCITVFSLSKTYAMTGWRIGYAVSTPEVVARMTRVQETIASSVSTPTQWAAIAALLGPQDGVDRMREAYRTRRDAALVTADRLGLPYVRPDGAFYLWLQLPESVDDTAGFALDLLADSQVALAPGSAFGPAGHGWVRLSLAASSAHIERGLTALADRIRRAA